MCYVLDDEDKAALQVEFEDKRARRLAYWERMRSEEERLAVMRFLLARAAEQNACGDYEQARATEAAAANLLAGVIARQRNVIPLQ